MCVALNADSATFTHSPFAFVFRLCMLRNSITMVFAASLPILMKETRSAVVLTRIAKKLRTETGDHRYRARVEDERASLRNLIWISCTRPLCE